jgi:hypothetical protein
MIVPMAGATTKCKCKQDDQRQHLSKSISCIYFRHFEGVSNAELYLHLSSGLQADKIPEHALIQLAVTIPCTMQTLDEL